MASEARGVAQTPPVWRVAVVAGAFGLFYAYAVWAAVPLLLTPSPARTAVGWVAVVAAVVLPIVIFAGAFALGWRRRSGSFALILLAGLGLSAVFFLNVLSFALTSGAV
ncbi:bacitracin resistance protein [Microbacterium sp. F1-18]|jgi:hypothetical protein|uniref:bacitracin resistance protein n=1 Tax=unclassified Microbacterium TaxID=2609290 RepID=UPI000E714E86|nr:bacitracin resistance protein [Microbacterium sp. AG238]RKE63275.1 hypothetical protein DEU36_0474 [Microbacterium sp. AG238]